MKLYSFGDLAEIRRAEKTVVVALLKSHTVLSSCRVNGGLREDLRFICNCQGSEPKQHAGYFRKNGAIEEYAREFAARAGTDYKTTAFLFTAANMNNMVYKTGKFGDLEAAVCCTAGVKTNAARAGDSASYYEKDGIFLPLEEHFGTINIIVLLNKTLSPGALVTAVVTAAEAKSAALSELMVPSCYSPFPATGTGTDQTAAACVSGGVHPILDAGKHSKAGELIGKLVKDAVKEGIALQDGWSAGNRGCVIALLKRFGLSSEEIEEKICRYLPAPRQAVFRSNRDSLFSDENTCAALSALLHIWEQIQWGILHESVIPGICLNYGSELAASVADKFGETALYREKLVAAVPAVSNIKNSNEEFLDFIFRSAALGFSEKWA